MEEVIVRSIFNNFNHFLLNFMYRYGVIIGGHLDKTKNPYYSYSKKFENFSYSWDESYGYLYLYIGRNREQSLNNDLAWEYLSTRDFAEFKPFSKNGHDRLDSADLVKVVAAIDEIMRRTFPKIQLNYSVRICQSPYHKRHELFKDRYQHSFCKNIEGVWICEHCEKALVLDVPLLPAGEDTKKSHQTERAKMKLSLRFKVMQRDNFTCKACGRNPREDGVKLHVDHIHPIAKGGKTELDNLHTLCQDCNLAKKDKIVDQMKTWKKEPLNSLTNHQ